MSPDHTLIYEQKLLKRIAAQERAVSSLFAKFTREVAPHLAKARKPGRAGLWASSPTLKTAVKDNLNILQRDLINVLQNESTLAWNLANDKTDILVKDYLEGTAINTIAREGMFSRNMDALKEFQKRKVSGMGLSSRVWRICDMTRDQLEMYVESGLAVGRSADAISRDVRQYLQNPDARFRRIRDPETGKLKPSQPMKDFHPGRGVYRSAYKNALRMTRTEANMAYRLSDITRYRSIDFITGYEVKLSASHPEFDICDHMVGRYPKNFTFSGWHPNCYCYIVPIMLAKKDFAHYVKTGNLPTGKRIQGIPPRAAAYVKEKTPNLANYTSKPYWLRQNFKLKDGVYVPAQGIRKPPKIQGTVKEARREFTPVSAAFSYISPTIKAPVNEALQAINAVHDDGKLPEIPINLNNRMKALGRFTRIDKRRSLKIEIRAAKYRGTPGLTTAHETGHFLDYEAIGEGRQMESKRPDGILKGVMQAADNSDAVKAMNTALKEKRFPWDGGYHRIRYGDDYYNALNYYLQRHEIWARAYAQYIAEKSGNKLLKAELSGKLEGWSGFKHWTTEDFAPIKKEIDKVFKELGWLKE